jgi:FkbM family methyltransferase
MSLLTTLRFIINHPLNRDSRIGSLLRFAKWQIGSRLLPGAVAYEWINGSRFLVKRGDTGLTGNIYTGLHEFHDMAYLLHVLCADDLFIDVGANVGSYTILACSAIGARGYAFEPIPATHQRLLENIRLNQLEQRVQCLNIGVGSEPGRLTFTIDGDTTNHALADDETAQHTLSVSVSTLDAVLNNEAPALMKIDVEGFETPVLRGAMETLKKPSLHSVIMELNGSGSRYGFDESQILELMLAHGFKTYSYNPMNRTLTNLLGKNLVSGNTLFIRDEATVLGKLKRAPRVTVHGVQF